MMACRMGFLNKYYQGICHKISPNTLFRGCAQKIKIKTFCLFSTGRRNYYDVLQLTPKATDKDIKDAYYRLSKQYHPDLNKDDKGAVQKFRELAEAYEVLGNANSRREYDNNMFRHLDQNLNEHYQPRSHRPGEPFRGRTTDYNYDEWYRQHYAAEEFRRRQGRMRRMYRQQEEAAAQKYYIVTSFLTFFMLVMLFTSLSTQSYWDATYDRRLASSEKKK